MTSNNFVTIAWDKNGEPCKCKIEAEGTIVDIYENWLYIHDEKAWKENSGFGKYTIMEISDGQLRYNRFKIVVARGSNDELFFVVEYGGSGYTEDDKKQMIGISYCLPGSNESAGIEEDVKAEFFYWLKESKEDWWYNIDIDLGKIKDFETFDQGDMSIEKNHDIRAQVDTCEHVSNKVSKNIKDVYPHGECSNCCEQISCFNCEHVFHHLEDIEIENNVGREE